MRIGVSGTHATGKTTLIAELHGQLVSYLILDEPYYELLEEGHDFGDRPSVGDIEAQLERSLTQHRSTAASDVLFDRCPIDFLAYLQVVARDGDAIRQWLTDVKTVLSSLDLVVFVPIERPDRIVAASGADPLRQTVDALLREMIVEDSYGFDLPHVEVQGSPTDRARQVLARVQRLRQRM